MPMRRTILVVLVTLVVVVGTAGANHTSTHFSFEEPLEGNWDTVRNQGGTLNRTDAKAQDGDFSLKWEMATDGDLIEITTNDTGHVQSMAYDLDFDYFPEGPNNRRLVVSVEDANGDDITFVDRPEGNGLRVQGSLTELTNNTSHTSDVNQWNNIVIEVREDDLAVFHNDTKVLEANVTGTFDFSSTRVNVTWASLTGEGPDVFVDDITVTSDPTVDSLELDVDSFMEHGTTQDYTVTKVETNATTGDVVAETDVTDQANVTSDDTTNLTVDETNATLTAIDDTSVNVVVNVTATFDGLSTTEQVTIANLTVDNLPILPDAITRLAGLFGNAPNADGDRPGGTQLTMQVLFVATMAGVAATVAASAFAGIGAMTIVLAMGWFQGWVGDGVMLGAVFTGLFIGLNLATNVDYSIRR